MWDSPTVLHSHLLHYGIYTSCICMPGLSESCSPWSNQGWIRLWWTRVFTKYYSMLIGYFTTFLVLICHKDWEFATFLISPLLWDMKQDQIYDVSSAKRKSFLSEKKKILRLHGVKNWPKGQINNVRVCIYNKSWLEKGLSQRNNVQPWSVRLAWSIYLERATLL